MNSTAVKATPAATLPDYSGVTERPGQGASAAQLHMMAARYRWAASYGEGKDMLEVACGAGMGLPVLAEVARSVTGGDVDPVNMQAARQALAQDARITLRDFDAQNMPFTDGSFDVVLLFEAIYYLPDAGRFLAEARRVLRPGGRVLLVSVNRQWRGFNPSRFSKRYYSGAELQDLLDAAGFDAQIETAFPEQRSLRSDLIAFIRRIAVGFRLIPSTMAGKRLLKRLFYGRLDAVPEKLSLEGGPVPEGAVPLASCEDPSRYRVLYACGTRRN